MEQRRAHSPWAGRAGRECRGSCRGSEALKICRYERDCAGLAARPRPGRARCQKQRSHARHTQHGWHNFWTLPQQLITMLSRRRARDRASLPSVAPARARAALPRGVPRPPLDIGRTEPSQFGVYQPWRYFHDWTRRRYPPTLAPSPQSERPPLCLQRPCECALRPERRCGGLAVISSALQRALNSRGCTLPLAAAPSPPSSYLPCRLAHLRVPGRCDITRPSAP